MIVKDTENQKELRLKTYRYPADKSVPFKGVILYTHGFSDYIARFAHLAEKLSKHGFDFFGMDQRGHGLSDG
jgi:alpha-beta hydrolase superfamily lysophospholipase